MENASDRNGQHAEREVSGESPEQLGEQGQPSQARPSRTGRPPRRQSLPPYPVRGGGTDQPVAAGDADIVLELAKNAAKKRTPAPDDDDTRLGCPKFWGIIAVDRYPSGQDRLLPELKLVRVPGGWRCTVQDVETSQETRFEFEALLDLARAAESHLTSGNAVWTYYKNRKNQKGIDRHKDKPT